MADETTATSTAVSDSDPHFVINPITREIEPSNPIKNKLIQYDHNSERFTFEIPKYIEGNDMTTCNTIQVHFLNISKNGQLTNGGVYIADDMMVEVQVDPLSGTSEEKIVFSWLISEEATRLGGSLNFAIRFAKVTGEVVEYDWHTEIFTSILISKGLSNAPSIVSENTDILEKWKKELFDKVFSATYDEYRKAEKVTFDNTDTNYIQSNNIQGAIGEIDELLRENHDFTTSKTDIAEVSNLFMPPNVKYSYKDSTGVAIEGAKGDGVTDDTAAIQNVIDNSATGVVYLPAGTYLVRQLNITRPVKIYGDGSDKTILLHDDTSTTDTAVIKVGTDDVQVKNCNMSYFSVKGTRKTTYNADSEYTGTDYNGIDLVNSFYSVITNVDISNCYGNGINITKKTMDCRFSNIHCYYNKLNGFVNGGYGNFVANLSSHENTGNGLDISNGGFLCTNVKVFGNIGNGVNFTYDGSTPILSVTLTNVETQQNRGHGIYMDGCYGCVISGFQSYANNFLTRGRFTVGETRKNGCGIVLANDNKNNYVQGVIISGNRWWNSIDDASIKFTGTTNVHNLIDICTGEGTHASEYNLYFRRNMYSKNGFYNFAEYKPLKQITENPLNIVKINGESIVDSSMMELTSITTNVNINYCKDTEGNAKLTVTPTIDNNMLSLSISDYSGIDVSLDDSEITDEGTEYPTVIDKYLTTQYGALNIAEVNYRRGYTINNATDNDTIYLRLTAKISDFKSFGVFPVVQAKYTENGSTKYPWVDSSIGSVKSNIIFGTNYVTKEIALPLGDLSTKTGLGLIVYLCATRLSDNTTDPVTIDVKEFSYKLCKKSEV